MVGTGRHILLTSAFVAAGSRCVVFDDINLLAWTELRENEKEKSKSSCEIECDKI